MKTHKDLDVWKDSMELVIATYKITQLFPKEELFCMTCQVRKAVLSVSSNISEGAGRNSSKEFCRFLHISVGSLSELETLLLIGNRLGYLDKGDWIELFGRIKKITSQLSGLIKSLKEGVRQE